MQKIRLITLLIFTQIILYSQERGERDSRVPIVLSSIDKALGNMTLDADLKNASFSFYVYDTDNNVMVNEYNADMSLVTASTMKVITTATALETMGSYHKFKTELKYDGYIDNNCVLHGNIYIKGGGDPTLGSRFYNKEGEDFMFEWVDAVARLGIHSINGRIIGDGSYFSDEYVPSTWGWGDMGNYYGAGVSGLSIFDNVVSYFFNSSVENNGPTTVSCYEPYSPDLIIDNRVKASNTNSDEAYIFGGPYDVHRILKGRIPKNEEDFEVKGSMHDPAYVAAFTFESTLWANGITVTNKATTTRHLQLRGYADTTKKIVFHEIESPSLSSIVYWTNLISNNLFAEHLLKHIGINQFRDGSVYSGTTGVTNYWSKKGVSMEGFTMNDGSGLSRANAVSARQMVEILTYMRQKSKYFDTFYSSLPNCGKTGTLSSYGKGTKIYGNLRAKSGTMTRVKSYAGYVKSASGKNLCFAMIINNFNCSTSDMAKKFEKLMISMGDYDQ